MAGIEGLSGPEKAGESLPQLAAALMPPSAEATEFRLVGDADGEAVPDGDALALCDGWPA